MNGSPFKLATFAKPGGGGGQDINSFLKAGDVMETEIESLGKMRNRLVAEAT
jgi:2-keto-4-pentenoate hydratase/2-oxohepta-3-ene-1,7-dioic acid hydratase in catechol pathway